MSPDKEPEQAEKPFEPAPWRDFFARTDNDNAIPPEAGDDSRQQNFTDYIPENVAFTPTNPWLLFINETFGTHEPTLRFYQFFFETFPIEFHWVLNELVYLEEQGIDITLVLALVQAEIENEVRLAKELGVINPIDGLSQQRVELRVRIDDGDGMPVFDTLAFFQPTIEGLDPETIHLLSAINEFHLVVLERIMTHISNTLAIDLEGVEVPGIFPQILNIAAFDTTPNWVHPLNRATLLAINRRRRLHLLREHSTSLQPSDEFCANQQIRFEEERQKGTRGLPITTRSTAQHLGAAVQLMAQGVVTGTARLIQEYQHIDARSPSYVFGETSLIDIPEQVLRQALLFGELRPLVDSTCLQLAYLILQRDINIIFPLESSDTHWSHVSFIENPLTSGTLFFQNGATPTTEAVHTMTSTCNAFPPGFGFARITDSIPPIDRHTFQLSPVAPHQTEEQYFTQALAEVAAFLQKNYFSVVYKATLGMLTLARLAMTSPPYYVSNGDLAREVSVPLSPRLTQLLMEQRAARYLRNQGELSAKERDISEPKYVLADGVIALEPLSTPPNPSNTYLTRLNKLGEERGAPVKVCVHEHKFHTTRLHPPRQVLRPDIIQVNRILESIQYAHPFIFVEACAFIYHAPFSTVEHTVAITTKNGLIPVPGNGRFK